MTKTIVSGLLLILAVAPAAVIAEEETGSLPLSFGVDYTLVSDYVWRGFNFSEYPGEGVEKLNHQLNVAAAYESEIGTFGGGVWFAWYGGQSELDPNSDSSLQEVDYFVSYGTSFGPVSAEIGWIYYQFPQLSGDAKGTQELYAALGFDDSVVFGEAILNPTFTYYYDLDDVTGSWIELGVSHDFAMADCEMLGDTFAKDITVTPSVTLGVDHRYSKDTTKLGNLLYGLDIGYDVSSALGIPAEYGAVSITGFLNFSQALQDFNREDEFFGGVTLSYAR